MIVSDGPEGAETRGLDLEGCRLEHNLGLHNCRFEDAPLLRDAQLRSLFLDGSFLPGFNGDRLVAEGGIHMRGSTVTGAVRLVHARIRNHLELDGATLFNPGGRALDASSARIEGGLFLRRETLTLERRATTITGEAWLVNVRIGGSLECQGAKLSNPSGEALNADRAQTEGNIDLDGAIVTGGLRLRGARIGGYLNCSGAKLCNPAGCSLSAEGASIDGNVFLDGANVSGRVQLSGARIGGDLECAGATLSNPGALTCAGTRIEGIFSLRAINGKHATIEEVLNLSSAAIGIICDHMASWPKKGNLILDQCTYGSFVDSNVPVDARNRIKWLSLQDPSCFGHELWPHPYEQCAKVLREMGHPEDAREILIEKERLQRAARRRRLSESDGWWAGLQIVWYSFWDPVLGATVRYGQQPMLAFAWLFTLWLIGTVLYFGAWRADAFKPNNPFDLRAPEWVLCAAEAPSGVYLPSMQKIARGRAAAGEVQLDCFVRQPEARSFPEFNAGLYSFDVLFPLVEIAQQAHWVPDTQTWPGRAAKLYHYLQIVLGWALSLLAVAGFSGLVRTD